MSLKAIHCGKLIDGTGSPFQENMTILIEGNIIKQVGKKLWMNTAYTYLIFKQRSVCLLNLYLVN